MFCTKCGYKNTDLAKFCIKCGEPIIRRENEEIHIVPKTQEPAPVNQPVEEKTADKFAESEKPVSEKHEEFRQDDYREPDNYRRQDDYDRREDYRRPDDYDVQDDYDEQDDYDLPDEPEYYEEPQQGYRHSDNLSGDYDSRNYDQRNYDQRNYDPRDYEPRDYAPRNVRPEREYRKSNSGAVALIIALITLLIIVGLGVLAYYTGRLDGVLPESIAKVLPARGDTTQEAATDQVSNVVSQVQEVAKGEEAKPADSNQATDTKPAETAQETVKNITYEGIYKVFSELNEYEWSNFSLFNVDQDGVAELICRNFDKNIVRIYVSNPNGADFVEFRDGVLTYNISKGLISCSKVENGSCYDEIHQVSGTHLTKFFNGELRQSMSAVLDSNGDPLLSAWDGENNITTDAYYSKIMEYYAGDVIADTDLSTATYEELKQILLSEDPAFEFNTRAAQATLGVSPYTYNYLKGVQFFVAPYTGNYRFEMFGANGGGDAFRDYDEEAATLTGTMHLKAGEKVIIMTGGAGGITVAEAGIVDGGFNGGGCGYWSGGGGGCTDIYYNGIRIAAAAGSGGGNYDQYGKVGRTSSDRKNITASKFGGDSPKVDCGGGGGGWLGGKSPNKEDAAGYGGVNGWNANYFTVESESGGDAYTKSGKRDGSVNISFIGN